MVHHPQATSGLSEVDRKVVKTMLERALIEFTGQKTINDAWSKCLPQLLSNDILGIKVNTTGYCPTRPELVSWIIEGLIEPGLRENNIIVFDHRDNNMKKRKYWEHVKYDVRFTSTDQWDFDDKVKVTMESQRKKVPLTTIVTQKGKYIINLPVLKDQVVSGIPFSLKNAYGYIPLFWGTRIEDRSLTWAMHNRDGPIQIAELNAHPLLREKTRLIVGDCLLCILNKGPTGIPQWAGNRLIIGKDLVAIDYLALKLLNEARAAKGHREVTGKVGHIFFAARLGIGASDEKKKDKGKGSLSLTGAKEVATCKPSQEPHERSWTHPLISNPQSFSKHLPGSVLFPVSWVGRSGRVIKLLVRAGH